MLLVGLLGGFGCLELALYDIKELTSATPANRRTSRESGPAWDQVLRQEMLTLMA